MAILGIDEVGRGPLAGPLVVSAVILPDFELSNDGRELVSGPEWILELKDSKKLSVKKRERLSQVILEEAPASGLGWVSPMEIDELGMTKALELGAFRAVKSIKQLRQPFSQIIIDGKTNFLALTSLEKYVTTVVKADDLIKEVSAASIVAKVARDHYMYDLDSKYPEYGFSSNVGYGTAKHMAAIREFGICSEHRKSFEPIKSMVGFKRSADINNSVVKNTTLIGTKGETAVCEYLVSLGHEIVARNFKTKICEIDIVSVFDDKIFFTEVKTRKNTDYGGGFEAIDKKKIEKMKFAFEVFLKSKPNFKQYQPLLAAASVNGKFSVEDFLIIR